MKKKFYTHIIEIDSLIVKLNNINLSKDEREHLISLIDSNLYHVILDAILSELSKEDKKIFLEHLSVDNHEKIWDFLNGKIENIEDKIKNASADLTKELHKDIETLPHS
ncbi:MAG: hypothetical protein ABH816_00320 [Candidatus Levyibacteriota bacterium]